MCHYFAGEPVYSWAPKPKFPGWESGAEDVGSPTASEASVDIYELLEQLVFSSLGNGLRHYCSPRFNLSDLLANPVYVLDPALSLLLVDSGLA